MRYDLIKAEMLITLVKVIHENKGRNADTVNTLYSRLGLDCAQRAFDILAKEEGTGTPTLKGS
jgi:hypothetical protein